MSITSAPAAYPRNTPSPVESGAAPRDIEIRKWKINDPPAYAAAKRAFDLVVGTLILILLIPMLPFIAIMIKLDTRGRVFYKQDRVGEGGRVEMLSPVAGQARGFGGPVDGNL